MTKTKKAPTYQYGIEITKPHSKDMYSHNDMVAFEMVKNIMSEIHKAYSQEMGTVEATNADNGKLHKIASTFTGYQFANEYDFDDMKDKAINALANIANWQLHEEYSYLCYEDIVPKLKQEMVGFWARHSYAITPPYWTNEIEIPCSKDLDMEMANEYS